jgi:malonyl-CoA decarboxylase
MSDAPKMPRADRPGATTNALAAPDPPQSLQRMLRLLMRPIASRPVRSGDVRQLVALCHTLLSERGEISGRRLATEALLAYALLDSRGREAFFDILVTDFSPAKEQLGRAADAYAADPSQQNLVRLQAAVEPRRQELFRRLNQGENGTAVLVELRRHLLSTLDSHPERVGVDADLTHLFRSWFNRGFLFLQRIDWSTSALVLERLIEYEAVHEIQGWRDLRRRLDADRRCYGFFHPALPNQPLIFIEIALVRGLPAKVQPLLDPEAPLLDPAGADCAAFYSITNCQEGLRGVSFGNVLIKQVVEELGRDFPQLKTFATISPVSGFAEWLAKGDYPLTIDEHRPMVRKVLEKFRGRNDNRPRPVGPAIQRELSQLCAYYLMYAKRNGKAPLDAVARFHLANGARLERLNWMGDTSPAGLARSLGFTVNYVYRLGDVERNHEAYARTFAVAASREFRRIARLGRRANEAPASTAGPRA